MTTEKENPPVTNFWISWYHLETFSAFELNFPWWISGVRCCDDAETVCAAVKAESEAQARELVYCSYDTRPEKIEFRFCNDRPAEWSPFCDRFPKAEWMKW